MLSYLTSRQASWILALLLVLLPLLGHLLPNAIHEMLAPVSFFSGLAFAAAVLIAMMSETKHIQNACETLRWTRQKGFFKSYQGQGNEYTARVVQHDWSDRHTSYTTLRLTPNTYTPIAFEGGDCEICVVPRGSKHLLRAMCPDGDATPTGDTEFDAMFEVVSFNTHATLRILTPKLRETLIRLAPHTAPFCFRTRDGSITHFARLFTVRADTVANTTEKLCDLLDAFQQRMRALQAETIQESEHRAKNHEEVQQHTAHTVETS